MESCWDGMGGRGGSGDKGFVRRVTSVECCREIGRWGRAERLHEFPVIVDLADRGIQVG